MFFKKLKNYKLIKFILYKNITLKLKIIKFKTRNKFEKIINMVSYHKYVICLKTSFAGFFIYFILCHIPK